MTWIIRLAEAVGLRALVVAATLRSARGGDEDYHAIQHLSAARLLVLVGQREAVGYCLAQTVLECLGHVQRRPEA